MCGTHFLTLVMLFLSFFLLLPHLLNGQNYDIPIQKVTKSILDFTSTSASRGLKSKDKDKKDKPLKDECTKLVAYEIGWMNWQEIINTSSAVFRPKTDKELQNLIKTAKNKECTIRVSGARGSFDGLVMQRREEDTIIVSLADYQTSVSTWQDNVNTVTQRARIGAGKSLYDLTNLIRSKGFLLPTRTAGRYFTIGGVVANMVHGGGKNSGFLHEDVTAMLVMLADGNILEITSEDELKYWRNSAGLLGIILAVEFQLLQDTGFQMQLNAKTYDMTSPTFFNEIVGDIFTAVAINDHLEFFFNPYDGELLTLAANMFSTPPDAARLEAYRIAAENLVNANRDYDISYQGAPQFPLNGPCDYIPEPFCLDAQASAFVMCGATHDIVQENWASSATTVNDGFYSTLVAKFHSLDTFAPAGTFPQMLGQFLGVFQAFAQSGSSVYYPTGGLQFRFVNPSTKQGILSPIPPIADLEASFLANNFFPLPSAAGAPTGYVALHYTGFTNINDEHSDIFLRQLETAFSNTPLDPTSPVGVGNPLIPVKTIHLGKQWGYGSSPAPGMKHQYYPFLDSTLLANAYSIGKSNTISDFNTKRLSLDPDGVFAGGAMMRWLDPVNYPFSYYEPRSLVGQSCYDENVFYQDSSCLSACCSAISLECIESGLPSGATCRESCECNSMICQPESKTKPKPPPKGKPSPRKMVCG